MDAHLTRIEPTRSLSLLLRLVLTHKSGRLLLNFIRQVLIYKACIVEPSGRLSSSILFNTSESSLNHEIRVCSISIVWRLIVAHDLLDCFIFRQVVPSKCLLHISYLPSAIDCVGLKCPIDFSFILVYSEHHHLVIVLSVVSVIAASMLPVFLR